MSANTHYEVLGVSPAASSDEIKKRFRDLARRHHPDVAPGRDSELLFRQINSAYQVLSNSDKRALYDSEMKLAALKAPRTAAQTGNPSAARTTTSSSAQPKTAGPQRSGTASTEAPRKTPSETLLDQATAAIRRMRYREAEMICRQVLRMDRRSAAAYEILGDIHKARGRTDEAIAMYSFVLQLDRTNSSVRAKFDKLVGTPSGPTMAGHAASAARHKPTVRAARETMANSSLSRKVLLFIAVIALIWAAATAARSASPASYNLLEWDLSTVICLAGIGIVTGVILSVNGVLAPFRTEMAATPRQGGSGAPVPLGIILIGFGLAFFYASLIAYAAIAAAQRYCSRSILIAYGTTVAVLGAFALSQPAAAAYFLFVGGNIVFLAFVSGWAVGDAIRGS